MVICEFLRLGLLRCRHRFKGCWSAAQPSPICLWSVRSMGVIVDNSYQYDNSCHTIFGGERDFIDRWAASLGGVEQVRADFFRVLDWPGYRTRMPEEVRSELLRDVGW